ncbi:sigma factor-like helix-turn-helix DNA-binding protein [Streptomyces sp. NPDC059352]|uniref:sigma factor-like helix-turn-helix DNA-binding protein n=1 Tax=Streptomyces sp. NPDC059352 TaxID=3346810 RepID=UPI0036BA849A
MRRYGTRCASRYGQRSTSRCRSRYLSRYPSRHRRRPAAPPRPTGCSTPWAGSAWNGSARETQRTAPWDPWTPVRHDPADPDPALLTALDTLTPPERLAFVLHDLFDVPYEEIARTLERTPAAARQLAAHARHRVQGTEEMPEPDPARQRVTVAACLAAARAGDSNALRALLDPDVALRADPTAVRAGVRPAHGAGPVAPALAGRIRQARPALVDGAAGLVLTRGGRPGTVFSFTVLDGRITSVDVLADEGHLSRLTVQAPAENTAPA